MFIIIVLIINLCIELSSGRNVYFERLNTVFEPKLVMAQVVMRHGHRNPVKPFKNDPLYDEKNWPGGYGELTDIGKRQQQLLGKYLRRRYNKLVPNGYSAEKVVVYSTHDDRTLLSAEANLDGMFPDNANESFTIHSIPANIPIKRPCPVHDQISIKYFTSDEGQKYLEKFQSTFEYLTEHTGEKIDSPCSASFIWDALNVEMYNNLTVPGWVPQIFNKVEEIAKFFYISRTTTLEMKRLNTGFLLKEILNRFTNKSLSALNPDPALILWSLHGAEVISILNTLGLYDGVFPPYCASVFFELYQTGDKYSIQINYKEYLNKDLIIPLHIPNCGIECPLEKFIEIYRPILPTGSYKEECGVKENSVYQFCLHHRLKRL